MHNMGPTLVASRTALPPKGEQFALGRPGGELTPTLVASRTALRRLGLLASLMLACVWPAGAFADPAQLALGKELFTTPLNILAH